MRKFGTAVVLALLLAGCTGGVEKDATYETAVDLKESAVRSGYDCPQWSDNDTAANEFDAGACLSDHRDQFRVYPTQEAREKNLEGNILGAQLAMATSRSDGVLLVGPNWTIYGPKDEVTELQDQLGGFLPDLSDVRMPS